MAKAEIYAGACGFTTHVTAIKEGSRCNLIIESQCKAIQKMADAVKQVDPIKEISFKKGIPAILQAGAEHCIHAACPVPVGITKAVEVEAQLNLPVDVFIKVTR